MPEKCCIAVPLDVTKRSECAAEKAKAIVPATEWKVSFWKVWGIPTPIPIKVELVATTKRVDVVHVTTVVKFGAVFKDEELCKCKCCEYRQYVKGYGKVNGNILRKRLSLSGADELDPDKFVEDGPRPYGHRDSKEGNRPNDTYAEKRADGCEYTGRDVPGLFDLNPGDKYELHLDFESKIVDVCNDNAEVEKKTWTIRCAGVA